MNFNIITNSFFEAKNKDIITEGLLFVGDPHVWSKRPGRRLDESFLDTVLKKLTFIAEKSNELNLWVFFTGDFFHDDEDYEVEMLIKVIKILKMFKRKPVTIVGNHEKNEWVLKEKDVLSVLKVTGLMDVIETNSFWGKLDITNPETGDVKKIAIGGTPYGQKIPYDLSDFVGVEGRSFRPEIDAIAAEKSKLSVKSNMGRGVAPVLLESHTNEEIKPNIDVHKNILNKLGCDDVVWLTHHDLAFEGTYPNSFPLHNIDGVSMLVNGHIHGTKKPVLVGNTVCYNPGNITRLSVDMVNHLPAVWSYNPFDTEGMPSSRGIKVPKLEKIIIPHIKGQEIFNFTGKHTKASLLDKEEFNEEQTDSVFVELLRNDINTERTDDAIFVKESLDKIYAEKEIKSPVKIVVNNLLVKVLQEKKGVK